MLSGVDDEQKARRRRTLHALWSDFTQVTTLQQSYIERYKDFMKENHFYLNQTTRSVENIKKNKLNKKKENKITTHRNTYL